MNLKTEILNQLAEAEGQLNINRPSAAKIRIAFIRRVIKKFSNMFNEVEVPSEELCKLWTENKK